MQSANYHHIIKVHDRYFTLYIDRETIHARLTEMARNIDADYAGLNPKFLVVLNGSFIFAADLLRLLRLDADLSFIKLSSYAGTTTTGHVSMQLGINEPLKDRHVIVVEDIIDTGLTLHSFVPILWEQEPASVKVVSLLVKPTALRCDVRADYHGFDIPEHFVVGYGLDYDGRGRNLEDIFRVVPDGFDLPDAV